MKNIGSGLLKVDYWASTIKIMVDGVKRNYISGNREKNTWNKILEQTPTDMKHARSQNNMRILCATSVGSHDVARVIDSLVAMGLWLRGADTQFLLCDHILPACEAAMYVSFPNPRDFAAHGPAKSLCKRCFKKGFEFYRPLPVNVRTYSEFITPDIISTSMETAAGLSTQECFEFVYRDMPIGEQARAGVLRFFGKATFEEEDQAFVEAVARRYLSGALITARAAERALDEIKPDCIVAHHGIYVPQGILGIVARKKNVRVINWGPSYRNTTLIYSHGDTYHHTFIDEPVSCWENRELSPEENRNLDNYLNTRRAGKGDWSWVTPDRGENAIIEEHARLINGLGLDTQKPIFGLLTNVLWDAQLYYASNAFPDMIDWLFTTLDYFIAHSELQLIVRIHPHEVKSGNRQPTGPVIAKRYPSIPKNIKIVDRDSPYSTYALMDLCRAVLIYGTKTGIELAPFGMPVIVAGDAWMRNKGISYDATSREEYLSFLDRLPDIRPLSPQATERARRYAYHYFFRRMIPLSSLDPAGSFPPVLLVKSLEDLLPGHDRGLDVICDGILNRKQFIYDHV
ncbi:MAG TPA: capsule biosynthesis protein [Candidatus Methylomirabilis sp.]|nr:capsule biosynthesis protein [Candidatus Methylomirabilis sp.]